MYNVVDPLPSGYLFVDVVSVPIFLFFISLCFTASIPRTLFLFLSIFGGDIIDVTHSIS